MYLNGMLIRHTTIPRVATLQRARQHHESRSVSAWSRKGTGHVVITDSGEDLRLRTNLSTNPIGLADFHANLKLPRFELLTPKAKTYIGGQSSTALAGASPIAFFRRAVLGAKVPVHVDQAQSCLEISGRSGRGQRVDAAFVAACDMGT